MPQNRIEREISRSEFIRIMNDVELVSTECDGCCNVMRFHTFSGRVLEIESITENGVPSMAFYDRSEISNAG